jgi:alcohol dehydrogenase (cytochrome c)
LWKYGGAVWLTGTYDPALNLVFFGVGNPSPWNANLRQGANLYTNSTVALDVDTGRLQWYHQYHGNNTRDLDTPHEHSLLTLQRDGRSTPITLQPNKTGLHFSLERGGGKFVAAKRFTRHMNIWKGMDPDSGKLIEQPGVRPEAGAAPMDICPSIFGGRNWAQATYHPETGLVYLPSMEMCNNTGLPRISCTGVGRSTSVPNWRPILYRIRQVPCGRSIRSRRRPFGSGGPARRSGPGVHWPPVAGSSSSAFRPASW